MRTVYSAVFHNLFLKVIALLLAVLTWSYIAGQLYRQTPEEERSAQTLVKIEDRNVVVKRLPVYVNLVGTPDKRYRVAIDKIKINPAECVVTGAPEDIADVSSVSTETISVKGLTKSVRRKVELNEIPGCSIDKGQEFQVVIPIVRKKTR